MGKLLAMSAFALTMSISPGPVNMMTLSAGLHHGPVRALPFVVGSTAGFTALLVSVGLAANLVAALGSYWMQALSVIGAAVIIWFGIRIALAPTGLAETDKPDIPRAWQGALMQWVNPKAWAACLAAVSLFELAGPSRELAVFASLYFALCLIGVGSWAVLGGSIRRFLANPVRMRIFNIAVGGTLVVLALGLAVDSLV